MRLTQDIGIDLGTTSVLVYIKNKGIVLEEPSIVAMDKATGEVLAVGKKAKEINSSTVSRSSSGNIHFLIPPAPPLRKYLR